MLRASRNGYSQVGKTEGLLETRKKDYLQEDTESRMYRPRDHGVLEAAKTQHLVGSIHHSKNAEKHS